MEKEERGKSMYQLEVHNFDIEKICYSGQCFRMKKNSRGCFEVVAFGDYLEMKQEGELLTLSCSEEEFERVWKAYLALDEDYDQVAELVLDDEYMKKAMEYGWGIRILKQDFWEMIISFLISQQNNIPRIRTCIQTICERYGEAKENLYGETYYVFPTPEALAKVEVTDLRDCNLGYRSRYISRTAQAVADGEFDLSAVAKMDYEQARQELLKLYGVGIKVSECICLYGLHHLSGFPVDTHIRHVLDQYYQNGFPFEKYKGVEGIVQQYSFYYDLFHKE